MSEEPTCGRTPIKLQEPKPASPPHYSYIREVSKDLVVAYLRYGEKDKEGMPSIEQIALTGLVRDPERRKVIGFLPRQVRQDMLIDRIGSQGINCEAVRLLPLLEYPDPKEALDYLEEHANY